jgi:hypothetical protein
MIHELAPSRVHVDQCVSAIRVVRCENAARSVQTLLKNVLGDCS